MPVPVAKSLLESAKWQRLPDSVKRKLADRYLRGGKQAPKQPQEKPEPVEPTRPAGKAPSTRPVRRAPENGGSAGTVLIEGMKVKKQMKPGEYENLLDSLPIDKRRAVYKAREAKKIQVG